MSYDGGCGDADCELCKADAEAARGKFLLMMGGMTAPERQEFARRFNEYEPPRTLLPPQRPRTEHEEAFARIPAALTAYNARVGRGQLGLDHLRSKMFRESS